MDGGSGGSRRGQMGASWSGDQAVDRDDGRALAALIISSATRQMVQGERVVVAVDLMKDLGITAKSRGMRVEMKMRVDARDGGRQRKERQQSGKDGRQPCTRCESSHDDLQQVMAC